MASIARVSPATARLVPPLSKETLELCRELQEDECLALEAIYETNFAYNRDDHGRLVFHVQIEADLQVERNVTVTEQAVQAFQPHFTRLPLAPVPVKGRGRGRGSAQACKAGRGRGSQRHTASGRDTATQHDNSQSLDAVDSLNNGQDPKTALPQSQPALLPPAQKDHQLKLQYLLPIELTAVLDAGYPLEQPPKLQVSSAWLSSSLKRTLLDRIQPLWQNDVSTFVMVDEITVALQDRSFLPDPITLLDRYFYEAGEKVCRNSLQAQLVTHDRLIRHSTFSSESFDCGICLETKKGARCSRIKSCGHVFCIECLHSFFELNIREGLVKNVCCADMQCVKSRGKGENENQGSVGLDEIEAIVGQELLERYQWLMEKQELESDPTITYCPRDGCNAAVPKEKDENYERLRICPKCSYSFCVYCRRTYHGTKSRCVFSQAASIVDKYVNGDDKEKTAMETRYGKTNLKRMVDMYLEEQANAAWIKQNTTNCPDCQLDIERSMGCAHMTCTRCDCHFCFRCGSRLNARDPYGHFSTPGLYCYNKLFDVQPSEENQMDELLLQQLAEFQA